MTSDYDAHVAVRQESPDVFSAQLDAGWTVGGGVNGGYLLAVVGNAVRAGLADAPAPRPDPVAFSAHFVSASRPGAAVVRTRLIRSGGTTTTVAAELVQGDQVRLAALATYGDLGEASDDVARTAQPPQLPPVEQCVPAGAAPPEVRAMAPLLERLDLRLDPGSVGWAVGQPSGRGLLQGWFRLPDREPDTLSLLTVVDALPPVTFDLGRPGWAPTIELSAHVRAVPSPGWLRVRHLTTNVAGGLFEEDCDVWDSAGRLVAQSRQLARLPR